MIIARITWVEVLSALARRQRETSLTAADVARAIQSFRFDVNAQYRVIEVDRILTERAGQLVVKYALRAYDSVQLASALYAQSLVTQMPNNQLLFISADTRLLNIAQTEGLLTDNPNRYP